MQISGRKLCFTNKRKIPACLENSHSKFLNIGISFSGIWVKSLLAVQLYLKNKNQFLNPFKKEYHILIRDVKPFYSLNIFISYLGHFVLSMYKQLIEKKIFFFVVSKSVISFFYLLLFVVWKQLLVFQINQLSHLSTYQQQVNKKLTMISL